MNCPNCGNNLNYNAKFCSNCGASINQTNYYGQPVQPKKNNGCLLATIIGIVLLFFVLPVVMILTTTSFFVKLVNNTIEEKTECTENGGAWVNNECVYNKQLKAELQDLVEQYTLGVSTTNITAHLSYIESPIIFNINSQKEVEKTIDGQTEILNLNGEKAKVVTQGKYITGDTTAVYILTEEGNVYKYSFNTENPVTKFETNSKIITLHVVDSMSDAYRTIFPYYLGKGSLLPDAVIGRFSNGQYAIFDVAYLNNVQNNILYSAGDMIKAITIPGSNATKDNYYADTALYVFKDGQMNIITAQEKLGLIDNPNNYSNLHTRRNVVGNGLRLEAQYIIVNAEEIYVITKTNEFYKITINNNVINTTRDTSVKVKDYEPEYVDLTVLNQDTYIKSTTITFENGKTKVIDGNGYIIFE